MKKITAMITSIVVLFIFTTTSLAQTVTASSQASQVLSELKSVKCTAQGTQDKLEISVDNYKEYYVKRFDKPDRIVIDIPNTAVAGQMKSIGVKSKLVKSIRYSQYDKKIARIVVDTIGQPKYYVEEKSGKIILYITNPIIKGITYYKDGNNAKLGLEGVKLLDGKKQLFTEKYESSGRKYTITFPSSLAKLENKSVKIDDGFVNTVQVLSNKSTKKTSISFTTRIRYSYEAASSKGVKGTVISIKNPELADRGLENRGSEEGTDSEEYTPSDTEVKPQQPDSSEVVDLPKTEQNGTGSSTEPLLDIKNNLLDNGTNEITIALDKYTNYNVMRITGPDRIVVDIPDTKAPGDQQTVNVSSSLVKSIRYAQYDNNAARIVIDTLGQPQYRVEERAGLLVILVDKPTYKNFTYSSSGDRVYFLIGKAKLTESELTQKKLFTDSYDETGLKYTITFNSSQADIGFGTMAVNDNMVSTVDIQKDEITGLTSVTFNTKEQTLFNTVGRKLTNDTAITLLKPFASEDKVVVIDAGHGGVDPGATVGDIKEKNLNLDIATRLNSLLKSRGIKTYMTREDDNYIGLYERTYYANILNADLFLSIHNNKNDYTSKGTETLYYPSDSGFGKQFAQMIQQSLISRLGTVNRKIVARPELVVLKYTKMPAALAEIGFMDNKDDRARLIDENFRQNTAEALYDGIIQALNSMGQ
jgi:N-acetylmuramoyl-L-alanine amidase